MADDVSSTVAHTSAPPAEGGAATGGDSGHDPDHERSLQRARDLVWRALNRRDRTVSEIRDMLADRDVDGTTIEAVVAELREGGYVDDARYAQRFAEDRRRLDAWGRERIERRLAELGVAGEHIAAAVSAQGAEGELSSAIELLRRRFPVPPADARERSRALGLLVRRGYDSDSAYEAIRRHSGGD